MKTFFLALLLCITAISAQAQTTYRFASGQQVYGSYAYGLGNSIGIFGTGIEHP